MTSSFGYGNYAALSAKLEKRYSNGLQFLTAYVWSHALANSNTPLSGSTNFNPPDPTNFASAYSSAAWDIRHSFTTAFNYDIPFGKGKRCGGNMNRFVDIVAGSWHANGLLSLRTGPPYTIAGTQCQGQWNRCMPDAVQGRTPDTAPTGGRSAGTSGYWFDPTAYAIAAPLTGGNLGLQSNNAPPTRTLDFSVFKDFMFTERIGLQFRAEAYNLANTPQFDRPNANLSDATFAGGNGNFGRVLNTIASTERHIAFSMRLRW